MANRRSLPRRVLVIGILSLLLTACGDGLSTRTAPLSAIAFGVDSMPADRPFTDLGPIAQYTQLVGEAPHIVHYFLDWAHGGPFDSALPDAIVASGAMPLLTWNPHDQNGGLEQPDYADRAIADGRYDALLRQWGAGLAHWGKPIYLRIGDEMNGTWDSWSPGQNGNTVEGYIAMWRHIVATMRDAGRGLPNVRFVWSPNVLAGGATDFTALYPGDAYVDWVGLDGYNWGDVQDEGWQSFAAIFARSYGLMGKLTAKPLMIPEIGCVEQGGDKAAWLTRTFLTDIPTHFSRIRAVVYFNENKSGYGEGDWLVDTSPASLAAYRQIVRSPLYQGRLP